MSAARLRKSPSTKTGLFFVSQIPALCHLRSVTALVMSGQWLCQLRMEPNSPAPLFDANLFITFLGCSRPSGSGTSTGGIPRLSVCYIRLGHLVAVIEQANPTQPSCKNQTRWWLDQKFASLASPKATYVALILGKQATTSISLS